MRTSGRPAPAIAAIALIVTAIVAVAGAALGLSAAAPSATPGQSAPAIADTPSQVTLRSPGLPATASSIADAPPAAPTPPGSSPSDAPSTALTPSATPPGPPIVATRIVVPDLGIDLAITKSPPSGVYPYCNVAMYLPEPFGQPGQDRATYLFAHARVGMFYPIYELTMVNRTPDKMIGMLVDVYTSDATLHVYQVTEVLPHQLTLDRAAAATHDELWLQTSEGPHGTPGKTQVVAEPFSVSAATEAAAHPPVHIVKCGY